MGCKVNLPAGTARVVLRCWAGLQGWREERHYKSCPERQDVCERCGQLVRYDDKAAHDGRYMYGRVPAALNHPLYAFLLLMLLPATPKVSTTAQPYNNSCFTVRMLSFACHSPLTSMSLSGSRNDYSDGRPRHISASLLPIHKTSLSQPGEFDRQELL